MLAAVGQAEGAERPACGVRARLLDRAAGTARRKRALDVRERHVRQAPWALHGHRSLDPVGLRLRDLRLPWLATPGAARCRQLPLDRDAVAGGPDHVLVADDAEAQRLREHDMLEIRRSADRGRADHGWLKSFHTFSFADYYDPQWMGYGPLRVINDDRVAPGEGFGKHGHRDMEILTYILAGALEHRDSMGNGSVIRPGDVQRMSAGTGVTHSEFNPSATEEVHFLQIWLLPEALRLPPGYEQKHFTAADKRGRLRLIAAPDAADGALLLHQQARVYAGLLEGAERTELRVAAGRRAWLQVARGELSVDDVRLSAGDGARTPGPAQLTLHGGAAAEVLVFDLP